ncbi:GTPase, partial [Escherichia coli]
MNPSDAIEAIEKPLSSLPYSLSRHILEHLRKLTSHEPVIGIMGKSGAGKSSLCNALFQGEVTPVSDVHAGTREVRRFRLSGHGHSMVITDLPGVGESREISLCRLSIQAMASGHPSVTGTVTRTAVRNFSRISFIPDITGSSRSVMNVMLPGPDL